MINIEIEKIKLPSEVTYPILMQLKLSKEDKVLFITETSGIRVGISRPGLEMHLGKFYTDMVPATDSQWEISPDKVTFYNKIL